MISTFKLPLAGRTVTEPAKIEMLVISMLLALRRADRPAAMCSVY